MELIICFILLIIWGHFSSKKNHKKKSRYKRRKNRVNYIKLIDNSNLTEKQIHYRNYLQSNHWKETRARALSRANYKCEKCNCTEYLQVHHLNYKHLWNEQDSDLLVLCRTCHLKIHKKYKNNK